MLSHLISLILNSIKNSLIQQRSHFHLGNYANMCLRFLSHCYRSYTTNIRLSLSAAQSINQCKMFRNMLNSCHVIHVLGVACGCPSGMELQNDTKTCRDIDECHTHNQCSQKCVNMKRSYRCYCDDGYVLRRNRRSCSALGRCSHFLMYLDQLNDATC